jgi:hypothetical protein
MAGVALDANAEESFFRQLRSPNDAEAPGPSSTNQNHGSRGFRGRASRRDMASGLLPRCYPGA